jgi:hypothetical protein
MNMILLDAACGKRRLSSADPELKHEVKSLSLHPQTDPCRSFGMNWLRRQEKNLRILD